MTKLLLLASFCVSLSAQLLDPALLAKPATNAWPTYNGDYSGRRFSTLTQINRSNVKHLTLAWNRPHQDWRDSRRNRGRRRPRPDRQRQRC